MSLCSHTSKKLHVSDFMVLNITPYSVAMLNIWKHIGYLLILELFLH